jgi:hypothetical protein
MLALAPLIAVFRFIFRYAVATPGRNLCLIPLRVRETPAPLAALHGRSCGVLTASPTARSSLRNLAVVCAPAKTPLCFQNIPGRTVSLVMAKEELLSIWIALTGVLVFYKIEPLAFLAKKWWQEGT